MGKRWSAASGRARLSPTAKDVMKRIVVCLLLLFVADSGYGEIRKTSWTYSELYEMADLVVIGMAVRTRDTAEKAFIIPDGHVLEMVGRTADDRTMILDDAKRYPGMDTNTTKTVVTLMAGHRGWEVVGQSTYFLVPLVMKGDKNTHDFVLHHYRFAKTYPTDPKQPRLPTFREDPKFLAKVLPSYLLFLKKEADGRYVALNHATHPVVEPCVWRLEQASEEKEPHKTDSNTVSSKQKAEDASEQLNRSLAKRVAEEFMENLQPDAQNYEKSGTVLPYKDFGMSDYYRVEFKPTNPAIKDPATVRVDILAAHVGWMHSDINDPSYRPGDVIKKICRRIR